MWVALIGGFTAALATLTSYMLGRRNKSGHVNTSEAETLWDEARSIRRDQREENMALKAEIGTLKARFDKLEREHEECQRQLAILTGQR